MFVRPAVPRDHPKIPPLVEAAFGRHDEALLVQELRADGDIALEFVATDRDELIGHVVLSRLAAPEGCLVLAPVSVDPERQRKGVGSTLIRIALEAAEDAGWTAVFVLGDPRYYRRFGFETDEAEGFDSPYPIEDTSVIVFDEAAFHEVAPDLVYPDAF
jgi:putative acetyltransferase